MRDRESKNQGPGTGQYILGIGSFIGLSPDDGFLCSSLKEKNTAPEPHRQHISRATRDSSRLAPRYKIPFAQAILVLLHALGYLTVCFGRLVTDRNFHFVQHMERIKPEFSASRIYASFTLTVMVFANSFP